MRKLKSEKRLGIEMTEENKGKGLDSPLKKAYYQLKKAQAELEVYRKKEKSDIAIIGISVNLPDAENIAQYWDLLNEGKSAIKELPENRKQLDYGPEEKEISGKAGFLNSISNFDYEVFNITPLEAEKMNPAHRLFLQNAWHALEDGGYGSDEPKNIGVYLGYSGELVFSEYTRLVQGETKGADAAVVTGNASAIAPGRIAHQLNLTGPAMLVDTACSSSLTAVHLACEALKNADCELAVAGGVNLDVIPEAEKYKVGFESENGEIKPFDKGAAGTMTGEGVASVLLKKLDNAIKDGDHIYGVIKATEVNHDGQSSSITAPSLSAQQRLLTEAWKKSKIEINQLKYIEAHGTGTKLGDPIEITAMNQALQELNHAGGCAVGTVKSNIGHLFASAGIASLIKCVLIAEKGIIPPLVNHNDPIDEITSENSCVLVNTEARKFDKDSFCGVSSFGFSGTNAHVVLGGYNQDEDSLTEYKGKTLFTLSAKNLEALVTQVERYQTYLLDNPKINFVALCYSTNSGRMHLKSRLAIVAESLEDILEGLKSFTAGENSENLFLSSEKVTVSDRLEWQGKADALLNNNTPLTSEQWQELATAYTSGVKVNWSLFSSNKARRIPTPHYKFDEIECWPKPLKKANPSSSQNVTEDLMNLISEMTGIETNELELDEEFFAYGVDSLVLLQVIEKVKADFNLDLKINDFYDEIVNLQDLIEYIEEHGTVSAGNGEETVVEIKDNSMVSSDAMTAVLERLDRIEAKLEYSEAPVSTAAKKDRSNNKAGEIFYGKSLLTERTELSEEQKTYIKMLGASYNAKTEQSKTFAAENRGQLADWINSIDYRHSLKELLYPIVAKSGQGAYMQDIDGNNYIDIGLGYGVSFFGNNPDFVKEAVGKQLGNGFELALQSSRVKSIAEKFCKLTGVERICFSNTGTEAVMAAVRLVRAKTGRKKVVIFSGSYHGTFDGILGMSTSGDGVAIPISAGTPASFVDDLIVLNFGSEQVLEYIAENANEIAGVLTEPVQSRKPGVQNGDFLKALRTVTAEHDIALILDEIITGFRIGSGGAQAYFNIKADLVTYGKVIGGGMPIGIIGGDKAYLDLIDGGEWSYGDESFPEVDRMLYGGTFCKHPLALAAVEAVLDKIEREKDELYTHVNKLSDNLSDQLNTYFKAQSLPVELVNFGGLFRFEFTGKYQAINNPIEIPLFFYGLIHEGVYTWERRICFMSTEHTQEDIDSIVEKVKKVIAKMQDSGFFSETAITKTEEERTDKIQLNHAQKRMWILDQMAERQAAYNLGYAYKLSSDFNVEVFKKAYTHLLKEHELLRANILSEKLDPYVKIAEVSEDIRGFELTDVTGRTSNQIQRELQQTIWKPFNLEKDSLIRLRLFKSDKEYYMALCVHHIVADGWSMNLIMKELGTYYKAFSEQESPAIISRPKWEEIERKERDYFANDGQEEKAFWLQQLSGEIPKLDFPVFKTRPAEQTFVGETVNYVLPQSFAKYLPELARKQKTSIFNVLQSLVKVLLYKYTGQKDIILGTSVHGRSGETFESIGNFINNIPLRSKIDSDLSFNEFLKLEKKQLFECFKHQNYPFDQLVADLNLERDLSRSPLFDVIVQLESGDLAAYHDIEAFFKGVNFKPISVEDESSEKDLFIEFVQKSGQMEARINFNTDVLERHQIDQLVKHFNKLVESIRATEGEAKIKTFNLLLPSEEKTLEKWNETEVPLAEGENFVSYFERQVELNQDTVAVSCEEENYTYRELNEKANQLAHFLLTQKTSDLIGVLMDRSPVMTITILGIWKAGKAYIPIDTTYPLERIASILEESKTELVLTNQIDSELKEGFEAQFENCQLLDYAETSNELQSVEVTNPNIPIDPKDLAYSIFTSGSTGKPKGAMIEHIGMINHMSSKVHDLNLGHLPEPVWSTDASLKPANNRQVSLWRSARKKDLKKCFVHYKAFEIEENQLTKEAFTKAYQALLEKHSYLKSLFQFREGKLWSYEGSAPPLIFKDEQQDRDYWLDRIERQIRYFELGIETTANGKFILHYYVSEMLAGHPQVDKVNADFISFLLKTEVVDTTQEPELIETNEVNQEELEIVADNLRKYQKMEFNLGYLNQPSPNAKASVKNAILDKGLLTALEKETGKSVEEICLLSLSMLLSRYVDGTNVTIDIVNFFATNQNTVTISNSLPIVVSWNEENSIGEQLESVCDAFENLKKVKSVGVHQLLNELDKNHEEEETNIERNIAFEFLKSELSQSNKATKFFSIYDLVFRFVENDTALKLELDYNTSAVSDELASRIIGHLKTVIELFVDNLDKDISHFEFIGQKEKTELLEIGKPKTKEMNFVPMIHRFEKIAELHPNKVAIVFNDKSFDYSTINAMSNQIAGVLKEKSGGNENCRIGVLMQRNEIMISLILAIQKAGFTYVPLDLNFPEERLNYTGKDAELDFIVCEENNANAINVSTLFVKDLVAQMTQYPENNPVSDFREEDTFAILYTSGTTGKPKGVEIGQGGLSALLDWGTIEFETEALDNVLAGTPICFDVSMFELFFPLVQGKTVLLLEENYTHEHLEGYLSNYTNIAIHTSPTTLSGFVAENLGFTNVSVINLAGETVPVSFRKLLKGRNIAVRNIYGPTETTVYSSCYRFDERYPDIVPMGRPIAGESIFILDANLELCPIGMIGQVCIGGKGVSKGYLNRPDLSEERFVSPKSIPGERVYLTGDFGRILPDGEIEFLGRKDNQVNVRGYRIELGGIEQATNRMEGVLAASAGTIFDPQGEEHIILHYVCDNDIQPEQVRDYLLGVLTFYMVPSFILAIDKFEKTINGKIDRSKLPGPFEGKGETKAVFNALPFDRRNRIASFYESKNLVPVIAQNASHCFDISVWQMFVAHLVGGKTVIYKNEFVKDVLAFANQTAKDEITVLELVPSYLSVTLDIFSGRSVENGFWKKLDYLMVTGEALKRDLTNRWFTQFGNRIPIINAYGPTEASDDITHHFMLRKEDASKPVPIGRTVQNMKNYVLDEALNQVPIGCKGLIYTDGIGVGKGYVNNPEKTNQVFIPSPFSGNTMYNTGDVGRYLPDGTLEYFGRVDHQIKIRGNRIELGEIEHALSNVINGNEAIVLLKTEEKEEPKIVAYIQNKGGISLDEIRTGLFKKLPGYMVPDIFVELETIPLSDNGKIDRKALVRMKFEIVSEVDSSIDESLTETETTIRSGWEIVLDHKNFNSGSNFFEVGGNSLKLMKLFRLLDDQFPNTIKVTDLFKHVTIKAQAQLFVDENKVEESEELVELNF